MYIASEPSWWTLAMISTFVFVFEMFCFFPVVFFSLLMDSERIVPGWGHGLEHIHIL